MALSYINNKEIKFGSAKPLNGVYTPGSPTREYEPLDSLGIYLNSGIPLSYGVENNRYMSMSDEFVATSQGNSYSFNQFFAAQMMLGFKLHDRFIACDTEHKIIGTEPLLHKAYLAEITEKTLDYFKIKIYEEKTRTFCIRMSSSEVPTSYVDLTNSFDENGLNLTQTDRQSFLSYYRFYPLAARDPSSRFEETLGVDYYLLPSAEGLKELSGDILSKFNAFISSDGTLTNLGNTAFAYAGDIDYVPNYRGETSEAAVSAAKKAEVILGQVEEMHADINQILPEMEENLELTKQYRDEAMSTEIGTVREDVNQLKGDLAESGTKRIYPNYTLGKYIYPWGGTSVRNDNRFKLSEPFAITKGTKVVVKAKGYDNNQTIIAETNAEASSYDYLVNSIDDVYRDYTYVATKDMYIAVSGSSSSSYPIVITTIERYNVYDIDETQVKNDILAFSANVTSSSILADFNNAERNRIYLISTFEIANMPVQEGGTLLCIGYGNGYSAQIYQSFSGSVHVRHGIGNDTWTKWVKLVNEKNISIDATKVTTDIVAIGENVWKPSLLPNVDNAKLNRIYTISSVDEENIPVKESGTLLCLGENKNYAIQMYSSFGSGLFYRQRRGASNGWTNWTQVVGGAMSLSDYASVAMFEKVGVIGDSYSSGNIWKSNTESRGTFYNLSWCQLMARRNGITVTNYSKGGLSTRTWLTDNMGLSKLNSSEKENLYILALGINDYYSLGMDYLGSISDIHDGNPSANADTFYGNYGRIVEAIKTKAPKAKIIMASIPSNESDLQKAFNEAILNIANHYSVPHIKLYNDYFIKSAYYHIIGGHPNAVGYSGMCKSYERLIEECMTLNFDYFNDYTSEE